MHHYPMQFLEKGGRELACILPDAIERDIEFSLESFRCGIIEGDDVRVIVVLEMGPIEVEEIVVAAENDGHGFCVKTLSFSNF